MSRHIESTAHSVLALLGHWIVRISARSHAEAAPRPLPGLLLLLGLPDHAHGDARLQLAVALLAQLVQLQLIHHGDPEALLRQAQRGDDACGVVGVRCVLVPALGVLAAVQARGVGPCTPVIRAHPWALRRSPGRCRGRTGRRQRRVIVSRLLIAHAACTRASSTPVSPPALAPSCARGRGLRAGRLCSALGGALPPPSRGVLLSGMSG